MNAPDLPETGADELSRADLQSALFAQLVLQQTNLAMLLLGKMPNPQTGETTRDLETARLFIDQLEMLEAKTKGNLTHEEGRLLQHSLMTLRMAFVEAAEAPAPAEAKPAAAPENPTAPASDAGAADEARKKFSKKY